MPSTRWEQQAVLYHHFAQDERADTLDFSEEAAEAMYRFETFGDGPNPYGLWHEGKMNGYAVGKRWLNWHLSEWKEAVAIGLLTKNELANDLTIPHPWIDEHMETWVAGTHLLAQSDEQAVATLGVLNPLE